jgi:hypothetical protein
MKLNLGDSSSRSVPVRGVWVKSNDKAKYVELSVEYFWTRVRFPPPPPIKTPPQGGFLIGADCLISYSYKIHTSHLLLSIPKRRARMPNQPPRKS